MGTGASADHRPLGWWVKAADAALDQAFDAALAGVAVDRRGWQVLQSLVDGPVPTHDLLRSLAAFDPPTVLEATVARAGSHGWVTESDGVLTLTAEGAALHRDLAPRVSRVREAVSAALPPEDYQGLVELLQRLVHGLRPSP